MKGFSIHLMIVIILVTGCNVFSYGQTTDAAWKYTIRSISIDGNQRTSSNYILRELTFKKDEQLTLEELDQGLAESRINLANTALFINHLLALTYQKVNRSEVMVRISVVERWYFWPEPIFETADQNINTWLRNPDLKRLNFGVNLIQENLRGYNERLSIVLRVGADEKYEVRWSDPAVLHSKKVGLGIGLGFEGNHEVPAALVDNRLMLIRGDQYLLRKTYGYLHVTFRPSIKVIHLVGFQASGFKADTSLMQINPAFLPALNSTSADLVYFLKADYRNPKAYPLRGSYLDMEARTTLWQKGSAHHSMVSMIKMNGRIFSPLRKRLFYGGGAMVGLVSGGYQPFISATGLGYGREFVRGFEYNVISGEAFALIKQNLKYALIPERSFTLPLAPHPKFKNGAMALYINLFWDAGYVYGSDANGNDLTNKAISGVGLGLDLVTYYDKVARIEWTVNSLGSSGWFLHLVAPI